MDRRAAVLVALLGVGLLAGGTTGTGLETPPSDVLEGEGEGEGVEGVSGGERNPGAASESGSPSNPIPDPAATEPDCPLEIDRTGTATALGVASTDTDPDVNTDTDTDTNTDSDSDTATEPRIVELYPNPTTRGNVGEYLVLEMPSDGPLENWTVTDGHTTAAVPNETPSDRDRVALTLDPEATEPLTEYPVAELEGHLRLAADGDRLELRNGTRTVDRVEYDGAPEGERWYRTGSDSDGRAVVTDSSADGATADGHWNPRGATCLPVSRADVDAATTFVLPDAPAVPRETIREADDRLLLAGYTITSEPIAADLVDAADRGVDVRVLLEGTPVGGTPDATADVLEALEDGGVDVRVIGGEGARYRYHHPKYAVADGAVLVTTENWKPSGVGGTSSRGWGVVLEDDGLAADLAGVFAADFEGWDTESGAAYRADASFVDDGTDLAPDPEFPARHDPETRAVESAELLVAPDNADGRLQALLAAADDEILIKQASIDPDVDVLAETVEAARRGVAVRILLDSSWYHAEENAALAADLERLASDESLSLEVRLIDDEETDRFEKVHAKGVVVDRETAVVGSANWNDNAFENNREVLIALHGTDVAGYYATVFEDDWDDADGSSWDWDLPIGLSLTVAAALAVAALVGRRYVRFGDLHSREQR